MTREEQIKQQAGSISDGMLANYVPLNDTTKYYEGYVEGARNRIYT